MMNYRTSHSRNLGIIARALNKMSIMSVVLFACACNKDTPQPINQGDNVTIHKLQVETPSLGANAKSSIEDKTMWVYGDVLDIVSTKSDNTSTLHRALYDGIEWSVKPDIVLEKTLNLGATLRFIYTGGYPLTGTDEEKINTINDLYSNGIPVKITNDSPKVGVETHEYTDILRCGASVQSKDGKLEWVVEQSILKNFKIDILQGSLGIGMVHNQACVRIVSGGYGLGAIFARYTLKGENVEHFVKLNGDKCMIKPTSTLVGFYSDGLDFTLSPSSIILVENKQYDYTLGAGNAIYIYNEIPNDNAPNWDGENAIN